MMRPTPRPGLLDIAPYVPGKAKTAAGRVFKLSSNESALGPAPAAMEAAKAAAENLHLYPDGSAASLRAKLGTVHGLDPARLIVGNGSDEILSLAARCYAAPGDEVLMTRHGFSYYPILARAEGCVPVMAEERDYRADVDTLLAAVTGKTKVVYLANPNNPTGTRIASDEVRRLRGGLRDDILLVLDGAYAEYVADPDYDAGRALVDAAAASGADNVIMTRTFSKIYGLGGLRVGWGYGPASVIDVFNRVRGPFNVNAVALAAAEAALGDGEFVETNRRHNESEMARVAAAMRDRGFVIRETEVNFILVEMESPREAEALLQHLESRGVLVRGLASSNMPAFLRVSIGSRAANDAFIEAAGAWPKL